MSEIENAIQEFMDNAFHNSLKPDIGDKSKALAIVALKEKLERENPEPLTLERLREMDGQPVYIVRVEAGQIKPYCISEGWYINHSVLECLTAGYAKSVYYRDINKDFGYIAYSHKPKERDSE